MSAHVITPPQSGTSPQTWYDGVRHLPGFIEDSAQAAAIARLETLFQELLEFKRKRHRLFGKTLLPQPAPPRGVWFWGGVGRGKSFLMDAFFAGLPYARKKRIHFHQFMQDVQRELAQLKSETDPLVKIAEKIARNVRVLCFDEFHVSDIADAMILGRLLEQLFQRGVILIATSNYPPDGLYPNGLQRINFLPTIALIKQQMDIFNLDGGQDHRLRALSAARTYLTPITADTDAELDKLFSQIATGPDQARTMTIAGRNITCLRRAPGVAWFDFFKICGDQRGQADYLAIGRMYQTVIVSGIPALEARQASEARRFTWLVDVFYDQRVKLIISADVLAEQLYLDGVQASEFFRTISRLTEMQTQEYLALPHQPVLESLAGLVET
ncbi:cell division protein ZapE [Silvimonas sp.]|uniref:cell division protein ZapE n=1 Tax=Silvimonas sp. TaxID=2650811 RepID=UPI0028459283|nr:cell division protein ZapE [Silvimonas sp.]MDR3426304.1 cell division protein ZapE [Silvimonas sp.]